MRFLLALMVVCGLMGAAPAWARAKTLLERAEEMGVPEAQMNALFLRYPAVVMDHPKPELRIPKNTDAYEYFQIIKQAWERAKAPTFAGRYVWATGRCGKGCNAHFLVDWMTGHVIDWEVTEPVLYSPNSTLVITKPIWEEGNLVLFKMQLGSLVELER